MRSRNPAGDLATAELVFRQLLTERVPTVVWSTDSRLRLQFVCGPGVERLREASLEPVTDDELTSLFPAPHSHPLSATAHRRAMAGQPANFVQSVAGRVWQGHVRAHHDTENRLAGCVGIALDISDGIRNEIELNRFFDLSLEMICVAGFDGYFKRVNPAFIFTLGFGEDELLARPFLELVHPDDRLSTHDELERLGSGRPTVRFVNRYRCADEGYKWIEWNAMPVVEAQLIFATARDVTERQLHQHRLNDALRETDERMRLGLEGSGVGLWDWNVERDEILAVQDWAEMFGYARGEVAARRDTWDEYVHSEDREEFDRALSEHFAAKSPYYQVEHRRRAKSGDWRWILERGQVVKRNADGQPLRVVGMHLDITGHKQAEEALHQTELRFRNVFAQSAIGMAMVDGGGEGTFLETNHAFEQMLGYEEGQLVERSFLEVTHPDDVDASRRMYFSVLAGDHESYQVEKRYRHRDGHTIWGRTTLSTVRDREQRPLYVIAVIEDITIRRQAEQQLRAEERLLRKLLDLQDRERRLIAYEIHDGLVQDVVGAKLILESIFEGLTQEDTEVARRITQIRQILGKAIDEGRCLISDLRPMIIDERGVVEALNYLVTEEEARGDLRIELEHQVGFDRLPALLEGTVYRVVQEALNNVKRHAQSESARVRLTESDEMLIIEVEDDGVGFDANQASPATFGLEGIRERARLFGGTATIQSGLGQGTKITVELPMNLPFEQQDDLPNG